MTSNLSQDLRRSQQHRKQAALTILSFALLSLIGILRHEMWRDEVHAWMLVRDSGSLVELFQNLRYEAHPSLWHLCLYGLQQLSDNPLLMQIFHWEIAVVNIILLNGYAPFRPSQKLLLSFGYFFFYEYALLSRGYSLGVLFLFLFCVLYCSRRLYRSWFYGTALALALAALANTTAFGFLLSLALSLLLGFEIWKAADGDRSDAQFKTRFGRVSSWAAAVTVLLAGWGVSLLQITRPLWQSNMGQSNVGQSVARTQGLRLASATLSDVGFPSEGVLAIAPSPNKLLSLAAALPDHFAFETQGVAKRFAYSAVQIWKAYVPIPPLGTTNFWNRNILVHSERLDVSPALPLGLGLGIVFSGLLFGWAVWRLRRSPLLQGVYITGVVLLFGFSFNFFWWGSQRHHGSLWLLLLACLWLLPTLTQRWPRTVPTASAAEPVAKTVGIGAKSAVFAQPWRDGFTWLLVLQTLAGCYFYGMDLRYSFASGKATAEFIQQNQLDQLTLVAMEDRASAAVSAYLKQPLFYPELNRYGTYWTTYEPPSTPQQLTDRINALAERSDRDLLLILSQPLDLPLDLDRIEPLETFESVVDSDESFYLYRYSTP